MSPGQRTEEWAKLTSLTSRHEADLLIGRLKEAARKLIAGISPSGRADDERSFHPLIQVVGRALILVAVLALIVTFLLQVLR